MIYSVDEIKREVRIALDQNNSSSPLSEVGDIDTLTLEEIIESKIEDAARIVTLKAPQYMLEKGEIIEGGILWRSGIGRGSGSILLPDDFLRLVIFKMSDWDYAVYDVITQDDPRYKMQFSRYEGIRGNPQKPIVAISSSMLGQVLEFFSCMEGENAHIEQGSYIPIPRIKNKTIEVSEKIKPAFIYYVAYLVALSIQYNDLATTLLNLSDVLL